VEILAGPTEPHSLPEPVPTYIDGETGEILPMVFWPEFYGDATDENGWLMPGRGLFVINEEVNPVASTTWTEIKRLFE
jgi:hypothetical protein